MARACGADLHRLGCHQRLRAEHVEVPGLSETLFGFMLFGVFMPFQVVLLPMSQVLGFLGVSSSGRRPGAWCTGRRPGPGTTLFFSQLLRRHCPTELVNAARIGRRRLLAHFLAHRGAHVHADFDGDSDLAVHQHLERLFVWRGLSVARTASP